MFVYFHKNFNRVTLFITFLTLTIFLYSIVESKEKNLEEIENYLNKISSLEAKIIQIDQNGNEMSGSIKLKKPGKLRLEYYNQKADHLIIASGGIIAIIDYNSNSEPLRYPTSSTPLKFLSNKNIKFDDEDINSNITIYKNYIDLEIVEKKPTLGLGKIIIKFQKNPIKILGWEIPLNNEQSTKIILKKIKINHNLEDNLFYISAEIMKFKNYKN